MFKNYHNTVYHYTSACSLVNIISENELWLTDRDYMNDVNDRKYVASLIQKIAKLNKTVEITDIIDKELLGSSSQYVFSTTSESDLINQWIYYGKNDGYCLEFDFGELKYMFQTYCDSIEHFNEELKLFLGDVIYEESVAISKLNEILPEYQSILEKIKKIAPEKILVDREEIQNVARKLLVETKLNEIQSLIKQKGNSCENEFRFLFQTKQIPEFTVRNGIITPFIKIKFAQKLPIKSIIIGPQNTDVISKEGLAKFLEKEGYDSRIIKESSLRIRK